MDKQKQRMGISWYSNGETFGNGGIVRMVKLTLTL